MVAFSLFEDDGLRRVYAILHVSDGVRFGVLKRSLLGIMLTWVPVALLAWWGGLWGGGLVATNFLADFAAYACFLVAIPLFMLSEPIIDSSTRDVARELVSCGIVQPKDRARLSAVHARIARLRKSRWPDLACVAFAYVFSLAILVPEFGPDPLPTWHVKDYAQWRTLTAAGFWEFLVALPLLNFIWLRFIWKILLWIFYLQRVSRMKLDLHPTHPDLTGGIGFISDAQGQFAIFILAYGISNIAAPVGYQIVILHYDLATMPVWGPLVGFAIGAPLLFTLPLLMFTKQLYLGKKRALATYRERVTERSRQVESRWGMEGADQHSAPEEVRELAELGALSAMFKHIEKMRVVPFDLRSVGQLMGSSFGSVATLLPLLQFDGDIASIFEVLGKLFGQFGGG